jgi:hypothetical protein
MHPLPVDIPAHIWSVWVFPPLLPEALLPEVLPPPEPPALPEEPPLVFPALLPLLPPELPPLELPALPPEPLPLFVMRELPLLGVLEEQPLAYATIGTARHAIIPKQCLNSTAILHRPGVALQRASTHFGASRARARSNSMFAPRESRRLRRRASACAAAEPAGDGQMRRGRLTTGALAAPSRAGPRRRVGRPRRAGFSRPRDPEAE